MAGLKHYIAKEAWCAAQNALVMLAQRLEHNMPHTPRLYYGGARSGHAGGPQVKVGLLHKQFPEKRFGFNFVYLLSGALYLSSSSLKRLNNLDIPIALNQNGVFFPAWYPIGWEKQNERMARAMESANHVFYQSAFCKRAADKFLGVSPRSSEVLYNGVDTDIFTPGVREPLAGRPVKLLLTGKIAKSTSSRLLSTIEGVAEARKGGIDVELDVYGLIDPDVMIDAAVLIERYALHGKVVFCGHYSRAQAADIYRSADIYAMNTHNDACPNTVLEAMACGIPVLYSASGGVPELVGDDAGVGLSIEESFEHKVSPTSQQFAEGLDRLLREHGSMALRARERACTKFDIKNWLNRHERVFADLLTSRGKVTL